MFTICLHLLLKFGCLFAHLEVGMRILREVVLFQCLESLPLPSATSGFVQHSLLFNILYTTCTQQGTKKEGRMEIFYLTMHSTHFIFTVIMVSDMVKDHSDSERGKKEIFYLTMHSTHFIYGYMASDIW